MFFMDYGTGAVMAVPAHDERDYEFAQKFKLEIQPVLEAKELPFDGDSVHIHSDFLNGLKNKEAISKINSELEKTKKGKAKTQYKLRDWLFSRQRYWGEPFPLIRCNENQLKLVPENELPVLLPETANYEPSEKGESPLARITEFVKCQNGTRVTDTMPGSAGSSWYFLRYTDPQNAKEAFSFEAQKYWMPVDLYIGGGEHTVGHLLYSRFWNKVLYDAKIVSHPEPFQKLRHQGIILGKDGYRMSKSRGNVLNPDDFAKKFGADATRIYITFLGPFERDKTGFDENGLEGVRRFLERIWRLVFDENDKVIANEKKEIPLSILKVYHKTIHKVTHDIENMSFNTAISAMMILVNELYKENRNDKEILKTFAQLLMPFAPHFAEELWEKLDGSGFVCLAPWPEPNPKYLEEKTSTVAIQVNGKMRGTIELAKDASEEDATKKACELPAVQKSIQDKEIFKIIYKQGKILSLIVK